MPKINNGSNAAFMNPAAAINMLGVLVSPIALKMLFPVIIHTISTDPGNQTVM